MSENEKLRALLAEALYAINQNDDVLLGEVADRIDAALAEPVEVYANDGLPVDETAPDYVNGLWEGMFTAQRERDEARAHLAAVEKLLPREAYISDQTAAENFAGYIEGLKHAHAEAVAAFHDATRLRSIIQQARIKAEDERDEARAEVATWKQIHDTKDELFRKGMAEVERERDEARASHQRDREGWDKAAERMETLMKALTASRDEARARADRLQKLVDETAVRVTELLVAKVSR